MLACKLYLLFLVNSKKGIVFKVNKYALACEKAYILAQMDRAKNHYFRRIARQRERMRISSQSSQSIVHFILTFQSK